MTTVNPSLFTTWNPWIKSGWGSPHLTQQQRNNYDLPEMSLLLLMRCQLFVAVKSSITNIARQGLVCDGKAKVGRSVVSFGRWWLDGCLVVSDRRIHSSRRLDEHCEAKQGEKETRKQFLIITNYLSLFRVRFHSLLIFPSIPPDRQSLCHSKESVTLGSLSSQSVSLSFMQTLVLAIASWNCYFYFYCSCCCR